MSGLEDASMPHPTVEMQRQTVRSALSRWPMAGTSWKVRPSKGWSVR